MDQFSDTQLIGIGLGVVAAIWLLLPIIKKASDKQNYPYVPRDYLFTKAENSFRGVLEKVVDGRAAVYGKVRIADVVTIRKGLNNAKRMSALGKIAQKHFDYVLCDASSSKILCVVELDDKSHNRQDRKKRDAFVKEVCRVASVPLINVPTKGGYNYKLVSDLIAPYLTAQTPIISGLEVPPSDGDSGNKKKSLIAVVQKNCPNSGCTGVIAAKGDGNGGIIKVCSICRFTAKEKA